MDEVFTSSQYSFSSQQINYIKTAINKSVSLPRFTCLPLPDTMLVDFRNTLRTKSQFKSYEIQPLLEKTIAPKLLQILDSKKELLSKQNLTESERNTFLATKAKAAGLSAQQLEAILNSGFLYVPYVDYFNRTAEKKYREIKNDTGKVIKRIPYTLYNYSLRLGILWYQLQVENNSPKIVFIQDIQSEMIQRSGEEDNNVETPTVENVLFKEVVNTSCSNLELETKRMEIFQLRGEVASADFFGVNVTLGKREGVKLDDTYWIEEDEEMPSGEIVKNKRGFVKIRNVADNNDDETAQSYGQIITGGNYSAGLSATELPLLGVNITIGATMLPYTLSTFFNPSQSFSLEKNDFSIGVDSKISSTFGGMVSLQKNLANETGISEFWLTATGAVGVLDIDGKYYFHRTSPISIDSSNNVGFSLTGFGGLGLLKKFYIRRFGLLMQGEVRYAFTRISTTAKDELNKDDVEYILYHNTIGVVGKVGLEIYATPTVSFGVGAEYSIFSPSNTWSVSVDQGKTTLAKNSNAVGPEVNYSGLGFHLWLNYSLPSLQ